MTNKNQLIRKKKDRITFVFFALIFFLGMIGVMCFYAEHFLSFNLLELETVNFFGNIYDKVIVIDTLLAFGIICFSTSFIMMLFYFLYVVRRRW